MKKMEEIDEEFGDEDELEDVIDDLELDADA